MNFHEFPEFNVGINYREQHPTLEAARKWRYITLQDVMIELDVDVKRLQDVAFFCGKHRERMVLVGNVLMIRAGYAWNGCTPKRWSSVLQRWVGTPDFQETILASLFHDALYQFSRTEHFPFHKSEVDSLFYNIIYRAGAVKIASVYHGAVNKLGKWTDKPTNGEYSKLLK